MKTGSLIFFFFCILSPIRSQVGIGTNTPDASAALDVSSSTQGILLPNLTTVDRDMIVSPAKGLFIYNTSSNCLNFYNGLKWNEYCNSPSATFNCVGQSSSGTLFVEVAASSVTIDLPYVLGDGSAYTGISVPSTGVLGLTANLTAGTLANGNGTLTFQITGTPTSLGTATFPLTLFDQNCDLEIEVNSICGTGVGLGLNDLNGGVFTIDGDLVTTSTSGTTAVNSTNSFTRCDITTGDSFYNGGTIVVTFSRPVNNIKLIGANMYLGTSATISTNTSGTLALNSYVNNCPSEFFITGNDIGSNTFLGFPNGIVSVDATVAYTTITITVSELLTYYGFCFEGAITP